MSAGEICEILKPNSMFPTSEIENKRNGKNIYHFINLSHLFYMGPNAFALSMQISCLHLHFYNSPHLFLDNLKLLNTKELKKLQITAITIH